MWNQQAGMANNSCQNRTSNTCDQPPQSAHFPFRDGASSYRQTSNWQNSAVPYQAVSSQQPAGGKTNNYYLQGLQGNLQNSYTNPQSGHPLLLIPNGHQPSTQQRFHLNSGFINSSTPPNMMKATPTYPQQDMSAHWNQQGIVNGKQSVRTQDGNYHSLKSLLLNENGESTKPVSAYDTTATSLPLQQVVCTSKLVSAGAHNRQTTHNKSHRQNGIQQQKWHSFSPSNPPPTYNQAVSQSSRKKNISTYSSNEKNLQVSSMSQKTQQYPIYLNSTHNHGEEAQHPFLSNTNELHLNPTDAQEQMHSSQMIARIAENLRNSIPTSPDGHHPVYTSSNYGGMQFASKSNQNMQHVTVTETYSNASQSLPPNSGMSLPKTTYSVMPRPQHRVDAPPQQGSVANVFYVTATGDGRRNGGMAANAFLSKSNTISKGNFAGSLSDAAQLMKQPASIPPYRNKAESSGANSEILEMIPPGKANEGSIHSSPGHTATRAVAVVQPLVMESHQVASKHNSPNAINQDESLCHPEKLVMSPTVAKNKKAPHLIEGSNPYPGNPNQMRSNKSIISHLAVFNGDTFVSSSDSAVHQDLPQRQLDADYTRSELAIIMKADQHVAPTAQQSVISELPVSQSGDKDMSENPTDPKACVFELSSVPAIPWKFATLTEWIVVAEKAQMEHDTNLTMFDSTSNLLGMFWNGTSKELVCKLKAGWYKDIIIDVTGFLRQHVTSDSVILSQVKHGFEEQLKSYHVLKENTVYSEPPYKSFWLNVNEQLDDIDKEFGIPSSLIHRLHMLESCNQPDQVRAVDSIHAQIENTVPNKVLSQTEVEAVDSGEEKEAFTVEAISTQDASPNKTDSADSSDQHYSFAIQVLSPEEAKVIFEQVQDKVPPGMDDSQPKRVTNSSDESELLEAMDITVNDSKLENKSVCDIQQICCISRWMEMLCDSKTTFLSKCECRNEHSLKVCADKTLDKEEISVQKEDNQCVNRSDSKFHKEGANRARGEGEENTDKQMMTWNEHSQTITPTENDHKCHSHSNKEPMNISSINSSQPSILHISDDEDEDLSSSGIEILSDPEVHCIQGQFKSTGSTQSCTSVSIDKEIENLPSSENEADSQMSDIEESCGQTQLISTDGAQSSLETEEEPANKCKPPVAVDSQPSTCRKVLIDAPNIEPLGSNVRAVQLVLFGSSAQDKSMTGGRKRHFSYPGAVPDGVPRPPAVVTVNLSPLKRKSCETDSRGQRSLKEWIHEQWRPSLPPTKIRRRSKLKTQKCTFASFSGMSLKKPKTVGPTNMEKLPASSEMRILTGKTKHCLNLKRRRSLFDRLKRGEKKMVTFKQPADQERNEAESGSHAVMSLKEYNVLRFNVLPNAFNFKDGSNEKKETIDPVPNMPALVEEKEKSPNTTITRERGTWYPNPEKKYSPLCSPPDSKTPSLFQEFQKKYREKTQPSMD